MERVSGPAGVTLWAVQDTSWSGPATRASGATVSWSGKAVEGVEEGGGQSSEGQGWALRRGRGDCWCPGTGKTQCPTRRKGKGVRYRRFGGGLGERGCGEEGADCRSTQEDLRGRL